MPVLVVGRVEQVSRKKGKDDETGVEYDYQRVTVDDGRGRVSVRLNDDCEVPEAGQSVTIEVGVRPYRNRLDGSLRISYRGITVAENLPRLSAAS